MTMSPDQVGIPISEAAQRLNLSENAVRLRIRRGRLTAYKVNDRWLVVLPDQGSEHVTKQVSDQVDDRILTRSVDQPEISVYQQLVASLEDQVGFLRRTIETQSREIAEKDEQIRAWIDEAKRKDMLIAHLQERVVELAPGAAESPESDENPRGEPQQQDLGGVYRVHEPPTRLWWKFW